MSILNLIADRDEARHIRCGTPADPFNNGIEQGKDLALPKTFKPGCVGQDQILRAIDSELGNIADSERS